MPHRLVQTVGQTTVDAVAESQTTMNTMQTTVEAERSGVSEWGGVHQRSAVAEESTVAETVAETVAVGDRGSVRDRGGVHQRAVHNSLHRHQVSVALVVGDGSWGGQVWHGSGHGDERSENLRRKGNSGH